MGKSYLGLPASYHRPEFRGQCCRALSTLGHLRALKIAAGVCAGPWLAGTTTTTILAPRGFKGGSGVTAWSAAAYSVDTEGFAELGALFSVRALWLIVRGRKGAGRQFPALAPFSSN